MHLWKAAWTGPLIYLLAGCFVLSQTLFRAHVVVGAGPDMIGSLWMHHNTWVRLQAGESPFAAPDMYYPEGIDVFKYTGGNLLDAVLALPLIALFQGAFDYLDVLSLCIILANGIAMQALLGRLQITGPIAWGSAALFATNPFVVQELGAGRPTQALLAFIPLALWGLWDLGQTTSSLWRSALLFGSMTALAGMTYWFSLWFMVIGALPVALALLYRSQRRGWFLLGLGAAIGICILLCLPFLWAMYQELQQGPLVRMGEADWRRNPQAQELRLGDALKMVGHISWIAGILLALRRRDSWPWLIGGLSCVLVAAGFCFKEGVPNPFWIIPYSYFPFFRRLAFPDRIMGMAFGLLSIAAALGAQRLAPRWGLVVLIMALLEIGSQRHPSQSLWPDETLSAQIIADPGPVIQLPCGLGASQMVWQIRHGAPIFGGMLERIPQTWPLSFNERVWNPFIESLCMAPLNVSVAYTLQQQQVITKDFRWALLDKTLRPPIFSSTPYTGQSAEQAMIALLGPPVLSSSEGALWDLHRPLPASPISDPQNPDLLYRHLWGGPPPEQIKGFQNRPPSTP